MKIGSFKPKETLEKGFIEFPELFLNRKLGILRKHDISMTSALGLTGKDN